MMTKIERPTTQLSETPYLAAFCHGSPISRNCPGWRLTLKVGLLICLDDIAAPVTNARIDHAHASTEQTCRQDVVNEFLRFYQEICQAHLKDR